MATMTGHWKDYSDMSLKRLRWSVTENATMTGDGWLKRLWWLCKIMFLLNYGWNYYKLMEAIKAHHDGEKQEAYTHNSHTMASQQLDPWTPRWVREKLREKNNSLPLNDPNKDHKPPAGVEPPLCKCKLECTSHYSLDYNTYGKRYWACPLPTSLFNWGWDEEQPRKVIPILTFTVAIINVIMNHVIFL
jgi:hypothetical protein